MDLRKIFDCMISVSELGRGQASKVIQAVEDNGNPYIVVKNNKPQAVIISIDEYTELMRAKDMLRTMPAMQNPLYNNFSFNDPSADNFSIPGNSPPDNPPAHNYLPNNIPSNISPDNYAPNGYSSAKVNTLTEDEINIFLQTEEND
jgi:prevent-host-death family protein